MLDVRVRAGEDEALAPCLLEETIMRGRRRGRNRPSPPSPPSAGSVESDAPGAQGAVKLLDATDTTEDTAGESPEGTSVNGSVVEVTDEDPQEGGVESDAVESEVTDPGEDAPAADLGDEGPDDVDAADQVDPAEKTVKGQAVPSKADEEVATSEKIVADPEAGSSTTTRSDTDEVAVPAGRQPQAASGNPLPRVLAVANQKGGVGKTTTSVNLGAALAELGFRVLVIDLDPQGNATTGLGIDARNFELSMYDVLMRDSSLEDCVEPTSMKNLFVAPATIALAGAEIELVPAFSRELKLKRAIESVIDDFDFVLIDCPPSLGLITVNALAAADEVLVPIQCEYYALEGLSQLMRNVHLVASNLNPRLDISTIVLTMYDARTKLADQVATEVREHFGNKVCRIVIPRTVRLSEAPSFGQPITAFDPASRGAIAYRELAKEVSGGTS